MDINYPWYLICVPCVLNWKHLPSNISGDTCKYSPPRGLYLHIYMGTIFVTFFVVTHYKAGNRKMCSLVMIVTCIFSLSKSWHGDNKYMTCLIYMKLIVPVLCPCHIPPIKLYGQQNFKIAYKILYIHVASVTPHFYYPHNVFPVPLDSLDLFTCNIFKKKWKQDLDTCIVPSEYFYYK